MAHAQGCAQRGERGLAALEAHSDGRHAKAGVKNGFQQFPDMLESAPLPVLQRWGQALAGVPLESATAPVAVRSRQGGSAVGRCDCHMLLPRVELLAEDGATNGWEDCPEAGLAELGQSYRSSGRGSQHGVGRPARDC